MSTGSRSAGSPPAAGPRRAAAPRRRSRRRSSCGSRDELLDELDELPRPLRGGRAGRRRWSRPSRRRAAGRRPHPRRVARPRRRLRAREAGREHPARGHPRDRTGHGQLAGARLVHRRGPRPGRDGALSVEQGVAADEPRREHRRHPGGRRPQLHDARRRAARARRARLLARSTWRSSGSTTCRRVASSPRSASRCAICSRGICRRSPRRGTTRSASGSERGCASTSTAGARRATRRARRGWRTRTRALSHTANGVYAAMWMAAAHAASLWADDAAECADAALAVVPPRSRLAEALRFAKELDGRVGGSRRRDLRALRPLPLGARDQQHRARRGGALRVRRLLLRDLRRRAGRPRHRHERCCRRLDLRRARADRVRAGRSRCTAASRARCPASTAITLDELAARARVAAAP